MSTIEESLCDTIIETVPQWYKSQVGLNKFRLKLNNHSTEFWSMRKLTPQSQKLFRDINNNMNSWLAYLGTTPTPDSYRKVKQEIALLWLKQRSSTIDWQKMLNYLEVLRYRTYENNVVTFNLVISSGSGSTDITIKEIQKIIDPFATSQYTFIKVDESMKFLDYGQALWADIEDTKEYKYHPEFLHPLHSILKTGEFSVHFTVRGDVVLLDSSGLLASCRKGEWYVYDVYTFKNTIFDIMGNYRVGCNLFEVMFDLSYKRHGALLVYDPRKTMLPHIVNPGSVLSPNRGTYDDSRRMLSASTRKIKMGHKDHAQRKKNIFLELSSLDGAIIYDANSVIAFGAMIESHANVGNQLGARTTATRSAFLWGGMPVKISTDGDIQIPFKSEDDQGNTSDATLNFA